MSLAQAALMRAPAAGAICAVIVYAAQPEEHDLAVPTLVLVPEADRTELLARLSPVEALAEVANPERDGCIWAEPEVDEMREQAAVLMPELDRPYNWVHTYVGGDKFFCVHPAEDEEAVRQHACNGGFPIDSVTEVANTFDGSWSDRLARA